MKINQTNIFLETLFSTVDNTDLIELRPINPKGVKQHVIFRSNTELLIEKIEEYEKNYNVFIGIQPRTNKSGKDSSVKKVICLWADIDAKDFKGGKNEALKQINKFSLNPTILIDSGNGYHAYWLLEKPFIINNKNDRKKIKKKTFYY